MRTLNLVLLLIAIGCFLVAALFRPLSDSTRIRIAAAGLAAFVAVPLIALTQTTT